MSLHAPRKPPVALGKGTSLGWGGVCDGASPVLSAFPVISQEEGGRERKGALALWVVVEVQVLLMLGWEG